MIKYFRYTIFVVLIAFLYACSDEEAPQAPVAPPVQQSVPLEYQSIPQSYQAPVQAPMPSQPVIIQQPPQVVQAAPQSSGTGEALQNMLIGGMIGHAIGNSGGGGYSNNYVPPRNTTIINKTVKVYQPPRPSPLVRNYTPPSNVSRSVSSFRSNNPVRVNSYSSSFRSSRRR